MTNTIKTTSQLLFNEEPIVINRLSAKVLGLNEAIVIQQIHYWLDINRKAKINFHDGRTWTYNTYENWHKNNFDFFGIATIKRIFKSLFDKGILLKGNYNKHKYDRKLWVTIDYDKLDELLNDYICKNTENVEISTKYQIDPMSDCNIVSNCDYGKYQIDPMENIKLIPPIAETNTEITKETSLATQTENKSPVVNEKPKTDFMTSVKNENAKLIEDNTHLLLDSKNKINKVSKWNKDRLLKAIDIFKDRQGEYFSLLEKIYKDDKNFAPKTNSKGSSAPKVKTKFHNINETYSNYSPDELKEVIKESQKNKFKTAQDTKDDKYINNDNKNAENQNKYVIDPWALNAIQNKSNVSLEGMTTSEILYIADTVGIKLELDKDLGAYMLAF